jgi:hypothetical protein
MPALIFDFLFAFSAASAPAFASFDPPPNPSHFASRTSAVDTMVATGTFDVELTPEASDEAEGADGAPGSTLGRMAMSKRFHGDLEGTSRGEMLTAMTPVEGSAGYVAIERVTGVLQGRSGTFVLQHTGTMADGEQHLSITIVPGSGTGELVGIAGSMSITIADGVHSYELAYTLP